MVGTTVYLPCLSGPIAVQASASPAGLRLLWSASVGGGPPIVAAGLVWTIGQDGVLYGLNPSTGAVRGTGHDRHASQPLPHPSVGAGLLLAPAANRVVAFPASAAAAPSTTTTTAPTTTTGRATTTTTLPALFGLDEPMGDRGGRRRRPRRPRRRDLVPAAPAQGAALASGEQDLEHGAHAGHDQRDRHDDRHHLYQRPMHGLPVADVGELVQHGAVGVRPRRLLGRAVAEGTWLAGRQVPDERAQPLWKVGLRRSGNVTLHQRPR